MNMQKFLAIVVCLGALAACGQQEAAAPQAAVETEASETANAPEATTTTNEEPAAEPAHFL